LAVDARKQLLVGSLHQKSHFLSSQKHFFSSKRNGYFLAVSLGYALFGKDKIFDFFGFLSFYDLEETWYYFLNVFLFYLVVVFHFFHEHPGEGGCVLLDIAFMVDHAVDRRSP